MQHWRTWCQSPNSLGVPPDVFKSHLPHVEGTVLWLINWIFKGHPTWRRGEELQVSQGAHGPSISVQGGRARSWFQVKGHRVQVSHPLGVSVYSPHYWSFCPLTSLFSSWMTFWEELYLLREDSSCVECCLNCILRVSFSSSKFRNVSLDCSPIKEQRPEKSCYPQTPLEPHSSFPHPQLHSVPYVIQAFSLLPTCLSHLPSLLSWDLSTHSLCIPPRSAWARVWSCIYDSNSSKILLLTVFSFFLSFCCNDSISASISFSCSLLFFNCSRFSSSNLVISLSSSSWVLLMEISSLCWENKDWPERPWTVYFWRNKQTETMVLRE